MKTLFDSTLLSGIQVKNRFVRSATWEKLADDNGHITDQQSAIYEELAINKVGLIITGNANIISSDIPSPKMMGMYDDSFIEEYRSLENMTEILNTTKIGYFSMSRPLLCEPDLIAKWESGDTEKAKCISCNRCFTAQDYPHCMLRE